MFAGCGSEDSDSRNAARSGGDFAVSIDHPYELLSGPDLVDLDVTTDVVAQRFTSNNRSTRIALVLLRLSRGADQTTPREAVVSLHSAVSGIPGPLIAQLGSLAVAPGYDGNRSLSVASSPILAASREYFIVVSAGAGSGPLTLLSAVNVPWSNVVPNPEFESFQTLPGEVASWLPTGTGRNLVMTIAVESAEDSASESSATSAPGASSSSTPIDDSPQTTESAVVSATTTNATGGDFEQQAASTTTTNPRPAVTTTTAAETSGSATPGAKVSTSIGQTAPSSTDGSSTQSGPDLTSAPTDSTSAPTDSTSAPTDSTSAPTDSTSAPTDSTSAPTDSTSAPTDSTSAPTDTVATTDDTVAIPDEGTKVAEKAPSPGKGSDYSPADDPETTRDLTVTLAAFGTLLAAGAATSTSGPATGGASGGRLSTLATKRLKPRATARKGIGDAGSLWRRPGTGRVDAAFSRVPARVSPYSTVVARVLIDGSWARAMTGSMSTLLWPIAAVVGVLWGLDVGDSVGLPAGWLLVLALVLGVLDSLAGGIVSLALTVVAFSSGAVTEWSDVRTLLGTWILLLSPALVSNVIRPLRRVQHDVEAGLRERIFDYVMAPVGVAFAIEAMTEALNGLSGTVIADGSDLTLVKWTVWIAMIARLALEDLAVHLFPERSRAVQPPRLPRQTKFWGMFGAALRFALYLFVAEPFFGLGWATVFSAILLTIPFAIKPWEDDLPNNAVLWKWLPRGFLRFAILVVLGGWLGVALLGDSPTADTVRAMTPWLFLPSALFGITEYFGRSGEPWPDSRVKRWGGTVLWGLVVLVLAGVIDPF